MKTAISIPDKVFEAAEKAAKRLGISRSELYVCAIQEYLAQHSDEHVTEELDRIYSNSQADNELDPALRKMQSNSLNQAEW
jgi:metal-responsive CopG/Arc/MetJ family transcriptional regulator